MPQAGGGDAMSGMPYSGYDPLRGFGGHAHWHGSMHYDSINAYAIDCTSEEWIETQARIQAQAAVHQEALIKQQRFSPPPRIQPQWLQQDPRQPDTLGWREWEWDGEYLTSPSMRTQWKSDRLKAPKWEEKEVIRGQAGIHALLVPKHWKIIGEFGQTPLNRGYITGIVERFGRFVLGTEGWRAEEVIIRELLAPSTEIGLKLEEKYPDVIIHYPEGEVPCKSEILSKLVSGNESAIPPIVPPSSSQSATYPQATQNQAFPLTPHGKGRRSPLDHGGWHRGLTLWAICLGIWAALMLVRVLA